MLPIYIGVGDEANQGLCTGTGELLVRQQRSQ